MRAALGDRLGEILPAEGHLLRLAEPHEVEASWKSWACILLKPDGLYPTRPATEGNKPAKLKAIGAALKRCDQVILATDCDREGQLIGQEILEHLRYRGSVLRALFTAQDPKSLRRVPAVVAALTRLRDFAHLQIDPPVIRRGKSGHFSDKALEGVSHHAIVPHVNVLDDLEQRIARLDDDEKRLLALICRISRP